MKGKDKQISLFTMPGFRKNLPSSKEDVSLEEPIKDHQHSEELLHEMNRISKAKLKFQEAWLVGINVPRSLRCKCPNVKPEVERACMSALSHIHM